MAVLGQAHRAIMDIGAGHNFAPAASFLRSKTAGGTKWEPAPSKVFLYVFDGVVENCHSVAILPLL